MMLEESDRPVEDWRIERVEQIEIVARGLVSLDAKCHGPAESSAKRLRRCVASASSYPS
jgi:hypothetical protein